MDLRGSSGSSSSSSTSSNATKSKGPQLSLRVDRPLQGCVCNVLSDLTTHNHFNNKLAYYIHVYIYI